MHVISKFIFHFLLGWKLKGKFPEQHKKYLVIAAPHTSWLDVPLGVLVRSITKTDIHFIGKKALFRLPQGIFFRWLGGFPIDRTKSNNTVDLLVSKFNENDSFVLGMSPEGTRKKVEKWKTGYYFIAKGAGVPIVKVALDFQNKEVRIDEPYFLTEDVQADMENIQNYYKGVKGKVPDFS
ncbi:1-acyl-sn-glycerol-3-phosphate acyltransferase [Flavicella marina]|uniref:1-acyl-sn-glycerol-3-phosphate acyltransferase n=1 Tax=Flavicella marina TaxID=1475951 RepID=UPI00126554D0|nr:1-acyl-sn-glycerol-3-phosphate acyltransferase [Flavicella marina]